MSQRTFKDQGPSINIDNLRLLLETTRLENLMYRLPHSYHYGHSGCADHTGTNGDTGASAKTVNTDKTEITYGEGMILLPSDLKVYGVVASTAITGGTAVITGSIAISPNNASSITEFPPATYSGVEDAANPAALAAQTSLTIIYNTLLNLSSPNPLISKLGTSYAMSTLTSSGSQNIYKAFAGLHVDGTLILIGGTCDQFYFIAESAIEFSTVNPVTIILSGGLQESNIFWVTQSSISVNDSSFLSGILIANESIVFIGTSKIFGSAFSRNAAVTLANTVIITKHSIGYKFTHVSNNENEMEYLSIGSSASEIESSNYSLRDIQN